MDQASFFGREEINKFNHKDGGYFQASLKIPMRISKFNELIKEVNVTICKGLIYKDGQKCRVPPSSPQPDLSVPDDGGKASFFCYDEELGTFTLSKDSNSLVYNIRLNVERKTKDQAMQDYSSIKEKYFPKMFSVPKKI